MSDPQARARLLARIGDINDFSRPRPLVSLEEFFDGNDDQRSFGYNLPDPPLPHVMFEIFRQVRDRPDVVDVLVEVKDLEVLDDPSGWPTSDTIYVITRVGAEEATGWLPEDVRPDESGILERLGPPDTEEYAVPADDEVVFLFWD